MERLIANDMMANTQKFKMAASKPEILVTFVTDEKPAASVAH
jgi:hypothetical protein